MKKSKDFDPDRDGNPFRSLSPDEIERLQNGSQGRITPADPLFELSIFNAVDLSQMNLPEPRHIVDGVLPEGASLLVAKPKVGKSMLMQQIAVAIAMGGKALGRVDVERGRVLYLLLEGSKRGLKRRLHAMIPEGNWPANLHFAQTWPSVQDGGVELLERFVSTYPDTRLIVIDTLKHMRGRFDARRSLYETDYEALHPFSDLYEKTGVSIVVIHHANKRDGSADVVDQVSGSTGLSGAVENVLAMVRDGRHTILKVRPREEEEVELAQDFDPALMTWVLQGHAQMVASTEERQQVLEVLRRHGAGGEAMRAKEIAAMLDAPPNNVSKLLYKLLDAGTVEKAGYGKFRLPLVDLESASSEEPPGSPTDPTDPSVPESGPFSVIQGDLLSSEVGPVGGV